MNYEKKYKEALERARQFSEHPLQEDSSNIVEYIFPELQESEDEKIRKEIIETFKILGDGKIPVDINYADIFTWLEKQGGQKFAWSEEDEEILRTIISDGLRGAEIDMLQINWLKSIKQRYTWKPNSEQLYILNWLATNVLGDGVVDKKASEILYTLYDDLKKL